MSNVKMVMCFCLPFSQGRADRMLWEMVKGCVKTPSPTCKHSKTSKRGQLTVWFSLLSGVRHTVPLRGSYAGTSLAQWNSFLTKHPLATIKNPDFFYKSQWLYTDSRIKLALVQHHKEAGNVDEFEIDVTVVESSTPMFDAYARKIRHGLPGELFEHLHGFLSNRQLKYRMLGVVINRVRDLSILHIIFYLITGTIRGARGRVCVVDTLPAVECNGYQWTAERNDHAFFPPLYRFKTTWCPKYFNDVDDMQRVVEQVIPKLMESGTFPTSTYCILQGCVKNRTNVSSVTTHLKESTIDWVVESTLLPEDIRGILSKERQHIISKALATNPIFGPPMHPKRTLAECLNMSVKRIKLDKEQTR